eukprot:gene13764-18460_t
MFHRTFLVIIFILASLLYLDCSELNNVDFPAIFNTESWVPITLENNGDPMPASPSWKDPSAQIFIGIASYRDRRCSVTLKNIFSKAKYPDRIFVGIVEQIQTEEDRFACIQDYCKSYGGSACPHLAQIKKLELTHQDARGPQYARFMQQSLMKNEEFCLQIDSHTDFVQDWDIQTTEMWGNINNEYAILSTALPDISVLKDINNDDQIVPHLCQATIDKREMIVNLPATKATHLHSPILAPLWSAGFSFSKCHAENKVPNDPQLRLIYDADEFVKYARLWTRGYDVYTPNKVIAVHDYHQKMGSGTGGIDPMEWSQQRPISSKKEYVRDLYEISAARIATVLGLPEGKTDPEHLSLITKYGLGTKRTLDQFIEFTGVDTRTKTIFGDRCKELLWVPFVFDADPASDSGDSWGKAPEILYKGGSNIPLLTGNVMFISTSSIQKDNSKSLSDPIISQFDNNSNLRGFQQPINMVIRKTNQALHHGKELWWIFQWVDSSVENMINSIDQQIGYGHGHQ